jgi:hypothetical protein
MTGPAVVGASRGDVVSSPPPRRSTLRRFRRALRGPQSFLQSPIDTFKQRFIERRTWPGRADIERMDDPTFGRFLESVGVTVDRPDDGPTGAR